MDFVFIQCVAQHLADVISSQNSSIWFIFINGVKEFKTQWLSRLVLQYGLFVWPQNIDYKLEILIFDKIVVWMAEVARRQIYK
jgi:hypothetical protein